MSEIPDDLDKLKEQAKRLQEEIKRKERELRQKEPRAPRKMKPTVRQCERCHLAFVAKARRQVMHKECAYKQRLELRRDREAQPHYRQHEKIRKGESRNINRDRARWAVKNAIKAGLAAIKAGKPLQPHHLVKPSVCSICNQVPPLMHNGKSSLRADHYKGYSREHWLDIRWICAKCDGKNETLKRLRAMGKLPTPKPSNS